MLEGDDGLGMLGDKIENTSYKCLKLGDPRESIAMMFNFDTPIEIDGGLAENTIIEDKSGDMARSKQCI